jgi:hypothetical protein
MPDRLDNVEDAVDDGIGPDHDCQNECGGDRGKQGDEAEENSENSPDDGENPDLLGQAGKASGDI